MHNKVSQCTYVRSFENGDLETLAVVEFTRRLVLRFGGRRLGGSAPYKCSLQMALDTQPLTLTQIHSPSQAAEVAVQGGNHMIPVLTGQLRNVWGRSGVRHPA